jgi:hypothetical protein
MVRGLIGTDVPPSAIVPWLVDGQSNGLLEDAGYRRHSNDGVHGARSVSRAEAMPSGVIAGVRGRSRLPLTGFASFKVGKAGPEEE